MKIAARLEEALSLVVVVVVVVAAAGVDALFLAVVVAVEFVAVVLVTASPLPCLSRAFHHTAGLQQWSKHGVQ